MAHLAVAENSEKRKSQEWFPKNPRMRKGGGVLYNCAAAPRAPTFATLPFCLPPQPSHVAEPPKKLGPHAPIDVSTDL